LTRRFRRAGLKVVIREVVDVADVKQQALKLAANVDLFMLRTDT